MKYFILGTIFGLIFGYKYEISFSIKKYSQEEQIEGDEEE